MMRTFEHISVQTVAEACGLLRDSGGRAKLNAGGTDLLSSLRSDAAPRYPDLLINIKAISGIDQISEEAGVLKIGALARLADVSRSALLNSRYSVLARAAHSVAAPQIRNMATLGGNLCQEVRCWYYRYPRRIGGPIQCLRKGSGTCLAIKGDNRYHAILGAKKCFAVCPSDTAVALTALDARLVIVGSTGLRTLSVPEFYHSLGNGLADDEMVREVEMPVRPSADRQIFSKFTLRKPIDFAIVSVAVVLTMERTICTDARIVLGAVGPAPYRVTAAEAMLIGKAVSPEIATQAAEAALTGAKPLSANRYKIEIAKTLVQRAILGEAQ
jgi:xanthine dehydrogenase YagS FAD-binding subunit